MARRGRRAGIVLGLGVAVIGGALAVLAVMAASLILLLVSSALVGFGNAALNLSRYAAADLYPVERRAGALGFVVWGSTIGAVVGPNLVAPAGALAPSLGLLPLAGGFAMAFLFLVVALGVAALGPRAPIQPQLDEPTRAVGHVRPSQRGLLAELIRKPQGRIALVALVTSQLVMTLVMTMTPYHLHAEGHGLETVGLVISAHTLGMFAFSPLSGRLTDRFGANAMILAGFSVLAVAGVLAAAIPDSGVGLTVPMFLLGVGWNLGFVAGSSLLASEAPLGDRARMQGATDALVWATAAVASFSSGYVVATASFAFLAAIGAAVAIVLGIAVSRDMRAAGAVAA
jgi:MFS family permease